MANIDIIIYETREGKQPFSEWLAGLKDKKAAAQVLSRLARIREGNFGDFKSVGGGVSEIRIDVGPGYRVYCGRWGQTVVVVLCGSSKKTQSKDIKLAMEYWEDWKGQQ
jgi:putative addiction module killer protein